MNKYELVINGCRYYGPFTAYLDGQFELDLAAPNRDAQFDDLSKFIGAPAKIMDGTIEMMGNMQFTSIAWRTTEGMTHQRLFVTLSKKD